MASKAKRASTSNQPHDVRVLIAPKATEINQALWNLGFDVVTWPNVSIQHLKVSAALDDAIENLYGYDWLIFINKDAVSFFLERLRDRGHEVSELDSLRVCGVTEATAAALEKSQVHIDAVANKLTANAVIDSVATYLGGRDSLRRLNFLIPQASIGRHYLKDELEDAGARADVAAVYQTVADNETTRLLALQSMLQTSSVDAVVFSRPADVEDFARLFDMNDFGKLLKSTIVLVIGADTAERAEAFGVSRLLGTDHSAEALAASLARHFAA